MQLPRARPLGARWDEASPGDEAVSEEKLARLPRHWRGALVCAYITGWRMRSEILTREWRHVDFSAGTLRLEPGEAKNRDAREFPLTPEVRAVLERQCAEASKLERKMGAIMPSVFFHSRTGDRLRDIRTSWAKAAKKAGLAHRLPHDFRRSAVRTLERAGVPRSVAMAIVGHRTESIYRRYAIVDAASRRDAAAKLAALHESERGARPKVTRIERARSRK